MPPFDFDSPQRFTPVPVDRFLLSTGFAEIHRPAVVPYLFFRRRSAVPALSGLLPDRLYRGGAGLVVVGQRTVDQHFDPVFAGVQIWGDVGAEGRIDVDTSVFAVYLDFAARRHLCPGRASHRARSAARSIRRFFGSTCHPSSRAVHRSCSSRPHSSRPCRR